MRALLCLVTDRGVVRGLDMAWLAQDIYLNIVKIFDLNFYCMYHVGTRLEDLENTISPPKSLVPCIGNVKKLIFLL